MWPFTKKPQPIWQRGEKIFLRTEKEFDNQICELTHFNVYAVEYIDVISGKKSIKEEWELD